MARYITCTTCKGTGATETSKTVCSSCKGHGSRKNPEYKAPTEAAMKARIADSFEAMSPTCLILGRPHQLWQNTLTAAVEWRPIPGDLAAAAKAFNLPDDVKVIK